MSAAALAFMAAFGRAATAAAAAGAQTTAGTGDVKAKMEQPPPNRRRMPYIRNSDLQELVGGQFDLQKAGNWMSVSEDVEFLPLMDANHESKRFKKNKESVGVDLGDAKIRARRKLARSLEDEDDSSGGDTSSGAYDKYNPYSVQPFVEGISEYDEYQQAWRLLGFMIDCNAADDDDYGSQHSGSGDVTDEGCTRSVIWAAYVDQYYEDGGIGEYQYWDPDNQAWDDTPCYYAEQGSHQSGSGSGDRRRARSNDNDYGDYNSRCAKMDCHLEDTNFSLLGFFKHRSYDDWMEQLFKHEGMCVWSEEQYAFMKNARKAWPSGCSSTGSTVKVDGSSTYLYYDIKPLSNGRIAIGLYTDTQCITEYPASTDYIEEVVGNVFTNSGSQHSGSGDYSDYDFSSDTLSESMDRWDNAFDVWRTCHPCVAHDLENTGGNLYTDDDDDYADAYYDDAAQDDAAQDDAAQDDANQRNRRKRKRKRKLGGEYSAQGDVFECYDDAGYTNVNQCMKFSAKTVMKTATFKDIALGDSQGSLAESPLSGYIDGSHEYKQNKMGTFLAYFFLTLMSFLFIYSLVGLFMAVKRMKASQASRDALLASTTAC
ncbi:hypothetical protein ACHAWF_018358 [Thalassiosira exigua]